MFGISAVRSPSTLVASVLVAAAAGFLPGLWGLGSTAHAATLTGTIVYEGKVPRMRPIPNIDSDPMCAELNRDKPLMTEFLVLGEGQTIGNIFVQVVSGLPGGKVYPVPSEPVDITQERCRYSPHVAAVRVGQPLRFLNPNGMQHNVHAMPKVNGEFNKSMSKTHTQVSHIFEKPEPMFRIKCDVHAWMESFCAVVDHPFFDITSADGVYRIDGLEPGQYEVEAWHEVMGTRRGVVTVKEGEPAVLDFTFTRPKRK